MAERQTPDRNLALELVRVTEGAAIAASRHMGRGDKDAADNAAVEAMRRQLSVVPMNGTVVIGQADEPDGPMLYSGESAGTGDLPELDIAIDPIDGTTLTALGRANAMSVIAATEGGTMFRPGPVRYMEKIAVGPDARGAIDILRSPTENLRSIAEAKNQAIENLTAVILDRDRHAELIKEVRSTGARIRLIPDGDIAGAISTAWPESGADVLFGVGGTPEGVISAAALRCMGGEQQGLLWPRNDTERKAAADAGYDVKAVLRIDDLVSGNDCYFAATGITDGDLLKGVHYLGGQATTNSLVMRSKSGTVRLVEGHHQLGKRRAI
jgi:fructose-1,6-bisphosphatase II